MQGLAYWFGMFFGFVRFGFAFGIFFSWFNISEYDGPNAGSIRFVSLHIYVVDILVYVVWFNIV